MIKNRPLPVLAAASGLALAAVATSVAAQSISEQDVIDAQTIWGEGIVAIATVHADPGIGRSVP